MKLALKTSLLGLAIAFTNTAMAQDIIVTIDPGLYTFSESLSNNGQIVFQEDPYEYCIPEERATVNLLDQLRELAEGNQCTYSNITSGPNAASADFTCTIKEIGYTIAGDLKGTFSSSRYEVTATVVSPLGKNKSVVSAERVGPCPKGWTPPPGISHE